MSTLRLQVDAGDPFQFLIVVKALTTISGLQKQIEEDFSELYGKHFQASLQVLRIQDPHHNDIPFSLKASSILKDMDKVYVVIKNLQLPPTPSTQDDTTPRPLTTPKFILPSADPYVGSTFTNLGHHLSLPGLRNNTQMEIDSKKRNAPDSPTKPPAAKRTHIVLPSPNSLRPQSPVHKPETKMKTKNEKSNK